jgi:hypothetical protein
MRSSVIVIVASSLIWITLKNPSLFTAHCYGKAVLSLARQ